MTNTWEITISLQEAVCLAAQTKTNIWPGIPSFAERMDEEINDLIEAGYLSLVDRGLIVTNDDGYPFLYFILNRFMNTVRYAWKVINAKTEKGDRWFFLTPETLLEQEVLEDHQIHWTAVRDFETLQQRTIEFLNLNHASPSDSPEFQMPLSTFMRLNEVQDQNKLIQELRTLDIPNDVFQSLIQVIRSEVPACSLKELNSVNPAESVWRLVWLITSKYAWQVEMPQLQDEDANLSFKQFAPQELKQKFRERMSILETR